jgi:hypothetical protein
VDSVAEAEAKAAKVAARARRRVAEEATGWEAEAKVVVDSVAEAEAKAAEVKEATVKLAAATVVAGKEGMAAAKVEAEGSDRRCPARCRRCRRTHPNSRTTCRRCPR